MTSLLIAQRLAGARNPDARWEGGSGDSRWHNHMDSCVSEPIQRSDTMRIKSCKHRNTHRKGGRGRECDLQLPRTHSFTHLGGRERDGRRGREGDLQLHRTHSFTHLGRVNTNDDTGVSEKLSYHLWKSIFKKIRPPMEPRQWCSSIGDWIFKYWFSKEYDNFCDT